MTTPVVVTRIQNRRGTQDQFDALYPLYYTGTGGFGSIPGFNMSTYPNVLSPGEVALCIDTRKTFLGNINGTYVELASTDDTGTGTVTSIGMNGTDDIVVIGGPITTAGTIDVSLSDTTVVPGYYVSANVVIDSKGRVTEATSGTSGPVSEIYYIDLYPDEFIMDGDIISQYHLNVSAMSDTLFATTIDNASFFGGIEFLQSGKYKVTINYIIHPTSGDWPIGPSAYGFDLATLSTGVTGYELNGAYTLQSVNTRYNPSGEPGLIDLPGDCPVATDVSTCNTFILDATVGSILWPAAYVKSFTNDSATLNFQIIIEYLQASV